MPLSDEEFEKIKKLWAEAYLRLSEIGKIILKHTIVVKQIKLKPGNIEFQAIQKDKDGNIIHTQDIIFAANGKVKEKKRWDQEE